MQLNTFVSAIRMERKKSIRQNKTKTENLARTLCILDQKAIGKNLTNQQKEVIKLLQQKEIILIKNKNFLITCKDNVKTVRIGTLCNLVNTGLVYHQTEWPFSYVLSDTGKIIKI